MGIEIPAEIAGDEEVFHLAGNLFARYREQARLLAEHLCPADRRIQHYLDQLQGPAGNPVRLPAETLILDQYGLARELSLPLDGDRYENELVSSYRLDNGVLHNPVNDRRTTQGVFHVAEGGLPIPGDKTRVPLAVFLQTVGGSAPAPGGAAAAAVHGELEAAGGDDGEPAAPAAGLPRGAEGDAREAARGALLRPRRAGVATSTSSRASSATPATRYLPANDAGLDVDGWTGHTGCVILAPHLTRVRKKDLGLPLRVGEERALQRRPRRSSSPRAALRA